MGSLMAGWDSPVKDPKSVSHERNKSLTKEEIAAYWKSKKGATGVTEYKENVHKEDVKMIQRSTSLPLIDNKRGSTLDNGSISDAEKQSKLNCWWTRSNWAFLNEPPVIAPEGPHKYASQHHVARMNTCSS